MRAGAAIFRSEFRLQAGKTSPTRVNAELQTAIAIAKLQAKYGGDMLRVLTGTSGIRRDDLLRTWVMGWRIDDSGFTLQSRPLDPQLQSSWSVDTAGRGLYHAGLDAAQVYTGHAQRFEEATKGSIRIASPDFVALTITPLGTGTAILITACGRCENTDMQFSADRRTVGRNWGHAPVRIEAVRGSVVVPEGKWTCHALAPDGSPKQPVPISSENGRGTLTLSPEYGTMWYLLQR
jgi:hypothetical protein